MQSSPKNASSYRSCTPPLLDSSTEDLCIDYDLEDLEKIEEVPRKPHFLDYDYVPPPGYEENHLNIENGVMKIDSSNQKNSFGEHIKIDKKYERDGEISDCVLANSTEGNSKRENLSKMNCPSTSSLSQSLNVKPPKLNSPSNYTQRSFVNEFDNINTGTKRKKHFLEESAITPVYNTARDREHRSLDRNFERLNENISLKYERKLSLDRDGAAASSTSYITRSFDRDVSPVVYHRGTWPTDKPNDIQSFYPHMQTEEMSKLGPKFECVYSLLSMLGSNDSNEMSMKFLDLSKSTETCIALRRSGCIPLLVQMMHSDTDDAARKRAALALHNVIHCHPDDKVGRREAKVLRLIEQVMDYNDFLKNILKVGESVCDDFERHPSQAIYSLMKISFDEDHRHAMCQLGALPAIANLVYLDHAAHGSKSSETRCITLRRYSCMALTNLTFGDGNNKALLCSNKNFMKSLVNQLDSNPEELIQVTACVLRNLSWRADNNMKSILSEIGTVTALTKAAMKNKNENTLKSILSALWNLTAHCSMNKAELCNVEGALAFLADMLVYEAPGKNLAIVENAGGILRNVSSHIAVREDYRKILRQRNCLGILLQQLKSESLTVVSNACGTLWNLSARCPEDQKYLCDNGAVPMLRSLVHSKHKMISNGSNAALKNLLNFKPTGLNQNSLDPIAKSMNLKELPSLNMRKQRALEEDLDHNLSETCENIDVVTPPKEEQNVQDFCTVDQSYHNKSKGYLPTQSTSTNSHTNQAFPRSNSREFSSTINNQTENTTQLDTTNGIIRIQTDVKNYLNYEEHNDECDDQLMDFSLKYSGERDVTKKSNTEEPSTSPVAAVYQETDIDQITDYSLRYAEKHTEADAKHNIVLDDTVKCYETEGTPYAGLSNATSMSDLRSGKENEKIVEKNKLKTTELFNNSGADTPEKPINYCEEGTPGYFSRRDSISSIEDINSVQKSSKVIQKSEIACNIPVNIPESEENDANDTSVLIATTPGGSSVVKNVTFVDLETPLMFSRHSSVESLSSAEQDCIDDRSSVVSDFSRLASGIISPSELPDSPTQSMPQTPRNAMQNVSRTLNSSGPPPLRSVFEDDLNTFVVENTPAQFSCATSLSNLSLDDEPKISSDSLTKDMRLMNHPSEEQEEIVNQESENKLNENDDLHVEDIELNNTGDADSDGEVSANDDILLATCINIGMNSVSRAKQQNELVENDNTQFSSDRITNYCTEGTPAILSKSGSNTNLSALSIDVNKADLSDDSSNTSDMAHDKLLEECIRDGMKKSQSKDKIAVYKENPIEMMRSGALLPPYLVCKDETNKFNVEGSPCNFSTMSALSNLTIESESGPGAMAQSSRSLKPVNQASQMKERKESTSHNKSKSENESLSSLSIDSEDDNNILSQAIAAGFESKPKYNSANRNNALYSNNKINKNSSPSSTSQNCNNDGNESLSSIDSYESNENQNSLFEQCIRSGMHKDKAQESNKNEKKSLLPTFKAMSSLDRDRKDRDKKDEQLLLECINTGISNTVRKESDKQPMRVLSTSNRRVSNETQKNDVTNSSKNGQATSVVALDMTDALASTTTDVEKELPDGIKGLKSEQHSHPNIISTKQNGYSLGNNKLNLDSSNTSINLFLNNSDILERSNEYPALKLSNMEMTEESMNNSSMEASNEFLIDNSESISGSVKDKHKDPDLMLRSVERLTHELVSTAEFLRTNVTSNDEEVSLISQDKKSSNSNNTWNEDTCPNDVSFPSVSIIAPMIISLNDEDTLSDFGNQSKSWVLEEPTPTNEVKPFAVPEKIYVDEILRDASLDTTLTYDIPRPSGSEFDSLEPESNTLTTEYFGEMPKTNVLNFEVGGEVKQLLSNKSNNTLTTSIIAQEANRIVNDLKTSHLTESVTSLDLDNIRPPSAMENLSISGYYEIPNSPQLSRNRKKSLPAGLVAKRAIGNLQNGGSLESVHSSCNLDNIKPPSLMDELLDSMISVASITSEMADSTLEGNSIYDTALSDVDDTITLQSCLDIPNDRTPIPSDFSSNESTPKKSRISRRSLTPKQKRQLIKDRYRTYTIAADMVLKEKAEEIRNEYTNTPPSNLENDTMEEVISIEFDEIVKPQRITPKQRRQENRSRFQTQLLDSSGVGSSSSIEMIYNETNINTNICTDPINSNEQDDDDISIKALTEKFKYINSNLSSNSNINLSKQTSTLQTNESEVGFTAEFDLNATECDQNSETESCDQNQVSDHSGDFRTFTKISPKIIKPDEMNNETKIKDESVPEVKSIRGGKKVYVSPYRRNIVNGTKMESTTPKNLVNTRTNLANKATSDIKKNLKTTNVAQLIPRNKTVISKTHVVINKTSLTNRINANKNKTTPSMTTKTETTKSEDTQPQMPARQGTFVKDQPTNEDVPVVSSTPTSPSKIPKLPSKTTSQISSKVTTPKSPNKTFVSKLKSTIQKSASMDADKIISAQKKGNTSKTTQPNLSNENQKRRSLGVFKSPSVPSVPQRTNSNVSMQSTSKVNGVSTRKAIPSTTPPSRSNSKTNITSKIAGLWKKTDDTKKEIKKPNQNISTQSSAQQTKLIRSSTFDSTPSNKKPANGLQKTNITNNIINNNTNKTTFQSKIKHPSTSGQGQRYIKSPSSNNIKSLTKTNETASSSNNANGFDAKTKRIPNNGTFVNGDINEKLRK